MRPMILPGEYIKVNIRDTSKQITYDAYLLVSRVNKGTIEVFDCTSPTGFASIVFVSTSKEIGRYWYEYKKLSVDVLRLENKDGVQVIGLENFFDTQHNINL